MRLNPLSVIYRFVAREDWVDMGYVSVTIAVPISISVVAAIPIWRERKCLMRNRR